MKKIIITIITLFLGLSLNAFAQNGITEISGQIAEKYPVRILIYNNTNNTVSGYYYYISKKIPIKLRGEYSESNGYDLKEYSPDKSGAEVHTGTFKIRFTKQGQIVGQWINANNNKKLSFTGLILDSEIGVGNIGIKESYSWRGEDREIELNLNFSFPEIIFYEDDSGEQITSQLLNEFSNKAIGIDAYSKAQFVEQLKGETYGSLTFETDVEPYYVNWDWISMKVNYSSQSMNVDYGFYCINIKSNGQSIKLENVLSSSQLNNLPAYLEKEIIKRIKSNPDIPASDADMIINNYVKGGYWQENLSNRFTRDIQGLVFHVDIGLPMAMAFYGGQYSIPYPIKIN